MSAPNPLRALVDVTSNQWGLVTAQQAASQGVRRDQLSRLEQRGLLERVIRGVYKDAGAGSDEFEELRAHWLVLEPALTAAERLAVAPDTIVVSGSTATHLHGYGDLQPSPFEFSSAERRQSKHAGLRLRRRDLAPRDVTLRAGLPVTTIERSIADLVADHEDLSLIGDVLRDAVRARSVDLALLSQHLAPLAPANGFAKNDGTAFCEHLLELSGSDERTQLARILDTPMVAEALSRNQAELFSAGARAMLETLSRRITEASADMVRPSMEIIAGELARTNEGFRRGATAGMPTFNIDAILRAALPKIEIPVMDRAALAPAHQSLKVSNAAMRPFKGGPGVAALAERLRANALTSPGFRALVADTAASLEAVKSNQTEDEDVDEQ